MARDNFQKIKLLRIMEILRQDSDEQHPMTKTELCQRLNQMNISCDPRTLAKDVALLNEQGYEIMSTQSGHDRCYYVEDRSFSVPEIKVLIDAAQAASFITEKKTAELIEKLAELGGSNRAAILQSNIVHFNTRKHQNEAIYYSVDTIEEAISEDKKIIFRYYDLDENGEKKYRRDGHHYLAEPVALVFLEDNYYLISYFPQKDTTVNYRVDRMESVEIIEDDIAEKTKELRNSVAGYTESVFKMYGGQPELVTIQFDQSLAGAVYDKFGEKTRMIRVSETELMASVIVQISPTFWGWIFQFGKKLCINSPENIRRQYNDLLTQI